MLDSLIKWSRKVVVTLRFSILAIFVTLFIISMMVLITITQIRFIHSMERLSISLMQQASITAFTKIHNQIKNAETKSYSIAQLIKLSVIDLNNSSEIVSYTTNFMENEMNLFSSIRSISWGDTHGDFIITERRRDNKIYTEIINREKRPFFHKVFMHDKMGKMIELKNLTDFSYDPRTRPWYSAAVAAKKPVWQGVYIFQLAGTQGTSVSTPVFNEDGSLAGVVNLQIRLDNLTRLVENTEVSPNSLVFIVSTEGKIIAFPHLTLYNRTEHFYMRDLTSAPWVTQSFAQYTKTHNSAFVFKYNNKEYLATYQILAKFGNDQWMIGIVAPAEDFISDLNNTQFITLMINLLILLTGIILVSILTTRLVRPLKKITAEINRIKHFDLQNGTHITSRIKEINYIADALYSMKNGLRIFQRYVPSKLVQQLIETGEDARIGGIKIPLAILFSDIKDFTTIAEEMDPDELTPHICHYFDELSRIIALNNGTIDKYIGDAIMAFWGAPQPLDEPAAYAAKAALRCIARSNQINQQWKTEGKPILYTRIGIHLGEAIVGNLGSSERINYTAVGDATNIASRLEGINKIYGTQIIVSDAMYQQINNQFVLRMIDCVTVKGKHESHIIYELIAETRSEVLYDLEKYMAEFSAGFTAYKNQHWDEAISHFKICLKIYSDDTVAPVFIHRCEHFKRTPPEQGWNGVWQVFEK